MLIAGLGSADYPWSVPYVTWCRASACKGSVPPLCCRGTLLVFKLISGIILPVFWANLCRNKLPVLPSLYKFQAFLVSMGVWWVFIHWSGFSVTVSVGSCLQWWFLLTGFPWIPPFFGLRGAKAPCHSSRHQFLSSPVSDEFNNNCRCPLSAMAAIKMPVIQYYNNFKPFCKSNQFYYFCVFLVCAHNNYLLLTWILRAPFSQL